MPLSLGFGFRLGRASGVTSSGPTRGPELITAGDFSGGTITNGAGTATAVINGDGSLTLTGGSSASLHFWSQAISGLEAGATYEVIVPVVNSGGGTATLALGYDGTTGVGSVSGSFAPLTRQIVAGTDGGHLLQFSPGSLTSSGRSYTFGPSLHLNKVLTP